MKKTAIFILVAALAAFMAVPAMAAPQTKGQGGGPGYGQGYGPGAGPCWTQLTPEQREKFQKAQAQFMTDTLTLRQAQAAKRIELRTLASQPNPDTAKVRTLADELVDIRAQIAKKRNALLAEFPGALMGRGGGFGHRGGRGGFGYMGGPGMGQGGGPGRAWGGPGPVNCPYGR